MRVTKSRCVGRVKDFVSRDSKSIRDMYYVYVLQSETDNGLYIGYTADLVSRMRVHNAGQSKSTSSRCPLRLIYYEAYLIKEDALGRECFLKSGSGRRYLHKQLSEYFHQHPRHQTA